MFLDVKRPRQFRRQVLGLCSQRTALHLTVFDELLHNAAGHVDGNGKADADVATTARQDRGVDTDEFTPQVDQGTAGVTRINGGIGLDKIFKAFNPETATPDRTYNTGGHGLAETERIANGDGKVAHLHRTRVGKRNGGQVVGGNLNDGDQTWIADLSGDFFLEGTSNRGAEEIAREAFRLASAKLSVPTTFVSRTLM